MNNSYITILIESLEKKSEILDKVIDTDAEQTAIISQEEPDMEALSKNMDVIEELALELEKLDDGFESVYEKVREELLGNKEAYREEIKRMQQLITEVTEKSVKVQTTEARNKNKVVQMFKNERRKLGARRQSARVLNDYKYMVNGLDKQLEPYFLDSKK
ncbi:MAG: flagellar protein FliT [Lachnospiraceae bacterium]|nr:flagellar protein FliT [Lachnospiraceae bacterium]